MGRPFPLILIVIVLPSSSDNYSSIHIPNRLRLFVRFVLIF